MRRFLWVLAVMIVSSSLFSGTGWAEKAYVTDSFKVTFRSGPSVDNKVIRMMSSGQELDVVETQGDWSHVRITDQSGNATDGWVLSRYLMDRMPWKAKAESLEEKNRELGEKMSILDNQRKQAISDNTDLSARLAKSEATLKDLTKKYESLRQGASNYLELRKKYTSMSSSFQNNKNQLDVLSKENVKLRSSDRNRWLATGALLLLCGLLIGIVMGRQQRRRKSLYE
jgi:SH3 domain protein